MSDDCEFRPTVTTLPAMKGEAVAAFRPQDRAILSSCFPASLCCVSQTASHSCACFFSYNTVALTHPRRETAQVSSAALALLKAESVRHAQGTRRHQEKEHRTPGAFRVPGSGAPAGAAASSSGNACTQAGPRPSCSRLFLCFLIPIS